MTSPELRDLLGSEIVLHFGEKGWRPAAFRGDDVSILLQARLNTTAGASISAFACPLSGRQRDRPVHLVSSRGPGQRRRVQAAAIPGAEGGHVRPGNRADGHPGRRRFLAPGGCGRRGCSRRPGPSRAYLNEKAGPLRFRLRPARTGARLHLEVIDPGGKTTTKEGDSTIAIDLPNAAQGRWQYRVGVETAPYSAFPAVLVVGTPEGSSGTTSGKMNPVIAKPGGNILFKEVSLGNKPAAKSPRPLRIAVTKPRFDDMGRLLKALGEGYPFTQIGDGDLIRSQALDGYDILFLTCNSCPPDWAPNNGGPAVRADIVEAEFYPEIRQKIHETLNRFVGRGGTLYVSDFRAGLLIYAFPDRVAAADFDFKLLPAIDSAEKIWLKAAVPQEKVLTMAETIDSLKLASNLHDRRDVLLAILHSSPLVNMKSQPGDNDFLSAVRAGFNQSGGPAAAEEWDAIVRVLEKRRAEITRLFQSRNQQKLRRAIGEISRDELKLKELRKKLVINHDGAEQQTVDAQVVDPGLQESIGETIQLRFPDNAWAPARFGGDDVKVLIRGAYRSVKGRQVEAPLLVRFRQGKGTVIFTSFHNEAQNSQQELELLRYLVFSAVTAKEEALTQETLLSGGFSPVKQSQINHQVGKDSITKKYQSSSGDPLRFALTFAGTGAKLRLTLVAPGGQEFEKETDETFVVEATGAPAGEWLYTVTSIHVPYENFAYSVSIGTAAPDGAGRKR